MKKKYRPKNNLDRFFIIISSLILIVVFSYGIKEMKDDIWFVLLAGSLILCGIYAIVSCLVVPTEKEINKKQKEEIEKKRDAFIMKEIRLEELYDIRERWARQREELQTECDICGRPAVEAKKCLGEHVNMKSLFIFAKDVIFQRNFLVLFVPKKQM